jgi:glycosyltransferase involved in cell wall biosynthesis
MMGAKRLADPRELLDGIPYHEAWTHRIEADVAYTFYHPLSTLNFRVKQGKKIASFHSQAFFLESPQPRYGLIPLAASYGTRIIGPLELKAFDAIETRFPQDRIKHRRTYAIPGWVNTNVFRPAGKKQDEFTVLFSGRALWQKGWDSFVSVARRLKPMGIRFLHVGGAVKDYDVIESLGFQPSDATLSRIYSSSHLLVAPSRMDTFGRASVESMACGTPVVTTPSDVHADMHLPFIFGRSVAEYEGVILRLKELWEEGRPYRRLSQMCATAAEAFSMQNSVDLYEKMFSEVVQINRTAPHIMPAEESVIVQ